MRAAIHTTGDAPPVPLAVPSFAEVYRDYAAFIWRALRRLGVRDADVEDVCQEVFLVVHRKLPDFEQRASVRTWLYSIALRCASDYSRRAHVKREAPGEVGEMPTDPTQATAVADRQARVVLDEILDTLDEVKRAVFVLYELEELSMAEVAEAVGCPLQTAYSRLHAARDAFEAAIKRRQAKERS
ncbi:MAG: RNA polymerase sigma factor [Deltaproteobacteria bacterium]|nr:RNA polymerase sigma factor [Deltaproteobacteria bacterium]